MSEARAALEDLAAKMHGDSVTLWNLAHEAAHGSVLSSGEDFPHREEIEAMQAALTALAWPSSVSR